MYEIYYYTESWGLNCARHPKKTAGTSSGPTAPAATTPATAPAAWDIPALFSGKALPPAQFSPFLIRGLLYIEGLCPHPPLGPPLD